MNLNRRSFFRVMGRVGGTAAVVVGGVAALPRTTVAVESPYTTPSTCGYNNLNWVDVDDYVMDPLREVSALEWKKIQREMMRVARLKSPIF